MNSIRVGANFNCIWIKLILKHAQFRIDAESMFSIWYPYLSIKCDVRQGCKIYASANTYRKPNENVIWEREEGWDGGMLSLQPLSLSAIVEICNGTGILCWEILLFHLLSAGIKEISL